jgi:hypothetical protein
MSLTQNQIDFCFKRSIRVNNTYMLPRFGFTAYQTPFGDNFHVDSNPFTKSLDYSTVIVLDEERGFYKVRFSERRRHEPLIQFYLPKHEMEMRSSLEALFLRITLWPFFSIYNLFKKSK